MIKLDFEPVVLLGQPGCSASPYDVPGPQAGVGPLQWVRPHHQELHQDLHRRQARVASQVRRRFSFLKKEKYNQKI